MKKHYLLLVAVFSTLNTILAQQYRMIVEKIDGTVISVNADEIYRISFREDPDCAVDLGEVGLSNCYIVSFPGDYRFPTGKTDGATAFLLWDECGENDITNVRLDDGYIKFTKEGDKRGNAVISLADSHGVIIWSWHIWSTETPAVVEAEDGSLWMDRNLGAVSCDCKDINSYGMYYFYGNHLPFPGYRYRSFHVSEKPAVPDGWYVAPGYGFYRSDEVPGPDKPMQVCESISSYTSSPYYQAPENLAPSGFVQPRAADMIDAVSKSPRVNGWGFDNGKGLTLPLAGGHFDCGSSCWRSMTCYQCRGLYPGLERYYEIAQIQDGSARVYYCSVNTGCPVRLRAKNCNE